MKKLREEIKGGELVRGFEENMFTYAFPKPGERSAKFKRTTYECEMTLKYEVTIEEVVEPAMSADGIPKPLHSNRDLISSVDVKLPFKRGSIQGEVGLSVFAETLEEAPQKIKETIGAKLAELEIRPPLKD